MIYAFNLLCYVLLKTGITATWTGNIPEAMYDINRVIKPKAKVPSAKKAIKATMTLNGFQAEGQGPFNKEGDKGNDDIKWLLSRRPRSLQQRRR
jgi:hypothetical protein